MLVHGLAQLNCRSMVVATNGHFNHVLSAVIVELPEELVNSDLVRPILCIEAPF